MSDVFHITAGDRREPLERTLRDSAGAAIDLTGATVTFSMKLVGGAVKVNKAAATVVTPAAGLVRFSWGATDTDTPGTYAGEFEITFADATKLSVPTDPKISIEVVPELA